MLQSSTVNNTLAQEKLLAKKSLLQVPVLIIGAGPTGLSTSILLSRYGIPSLLVERHVGTSIYPRAVGVSTRTVELLRQWGLEERVRAVGLDLICTYAPIVPVLGQSEVARLPLGFPQDFEALAVSPVTPCACPQDFLEPILLACARSYSEAQVVFGTELTAIERDEEGVSATLIDRTSGDSTLVRAHYVVAADGIHSRIRNLLGIAVQGAEHLTDHLSILFRADLKHLIKVRAHGAYLIQNPQVSGMMMPTSTDDRWIFGIDWHPERGEQLADYDNEHCVHLVRMATGLPHLEVKMIAVQPFTFAAQVAQRYREGNVFLAGDAAHRMTPSGGMGMNTSIHDAHNLAWKLAAVLNGWADASLLETYKSERRPVGLRNTMRSMGQHEGGKPLSGLEIDLDYCYKSTAVVPEYSSMDGSVVGISSFTSQPGKRAPHVWLERDGKRISTLDLYDQTLTLLTSDRGAAWSEAAHEVRTQGVPLAVQSIRPEGDLRDVDHNWSETYGIDEDGALLIRPDGFIAWRQRGMAHDHQTELNNVINQILGHNSSRSQIDTGLHSEELENVHQMSGSL